MSNSSSSILTDKRFAITVTRSTAIRNILRSGLAQSEKQDSEKIPMYVSWPEWLDDGIVCLYASDLQRVLHDVIHETAETVTGVVSTLIEKEDS